MRWPWTKTPEEKKLDAVRREARAVAAESATIKERLHLEYLLSKHRVLKSAGKIEYERPTPKPPRQQTALMRVPAFAGDNIRFDQNGKTDRYPFFEQENWQTVRFETDEIGLGLGSFFRNSNDLGWLMGWSPASLGLGGQFPREMMPGSMSSIRTMTGLDLLRFQSKIMFETIAPYSGAVNHLCNYVCGDKGATITASSKKDKKLAKEVSDFYEKWTDKIGFLCKLRACCNQLLVQGECFPRRWKDGRVTLTDPSWIRGPHNEIGQSPWSYGILSPNWPMEVETVGAFHCWYPSNEHETLSPLEQFHARLDTSAGPSAKRSVALSYRIRPLLPMLEYLITEMGQGETKRQRIAAVLSLPEGADKASWMKKGVDSPFAGSLLDVLGDDGGFPQGFYNDETGFYEMPKPMQFDAPPVGQAASTSGCQTYDKIATVAANAVGVASWMFGSDFDEASYATSLTASEPSVKTAKNIQRILAEVWKDVAQAEALYGIESDFPEDMFTDGDLRVRIELPNVEVRDMNELYDRLSKQMADGLKSPQHVASEMGDDYEEERELTVIAEADGWEKPGMEKAENGETALDNGKQKAKTD